MTCDPTPANTRPNGSATSRPGWPPSRSRSPSPGTPSTPPASPWLPLLNGDGLPTDDPRALIVRRDFGDGQIWGTTSISLVALTPAGLRYDFTAHPGDPAAWYPVPLG